MILFCVRKFLIFTRQNRCGNTIRELYYPKGELKEPFLSDIFIKNRMKNLLLFLILSLSFVITMAQNVAIGTTTASTRLYVLSDQQSVATYDGPEGMYIILREAGLYRGYIGSFSGNTTDVDFGTGSGNASGRTHLTIQGVPKLTIEANGNTNLNGELNRADKTGAANLLPICYGNVSAAGFVSAGSGNITVTHISAGFYSIAITDESYQFQQYITVVTPIGTTTPAVAATGSGGGELQVTIYNLSGTRVDTNFHFVVYKP